MDIRNILTLIWRRLWLMGLAALVAGTAVFSFMSRSGAIPRYSATAIVAIGGDMYQEEQDPTYLNLAETLMGDLLHLAQLEIITGAVVNNLGLSDSPKELAGKLEVSQIEGTMLISVRATDDDPVMAAAIANEVVQQFRLFAPDRWRNFVLMVEAARPPTSANKTAVLPVMLTAFTAALFTISGFFLALYLRQPIFDERDVAELVQLPLLATLKPIPLIWWRSLQGKLFENTESFDCWVLKEVCQNRLSENASNAPNATILLFSPDETVSPAFIATQLAHCWVDTGESTLLVDLDTTTRKFSTGQVQHGIDIVWEAAQQHAITVVHTPPMASHLGALKAAQRADLVLLVLDAWQSRYQDAAENLAMLSANGVQVDGAVLANLGTRSVLFDLSRVLAPLVQRFLKRERQRREESRPVVQVGS